MIQSWRDGSQSRHLAIGLTVNQAAEGINMQSVDYQSLVIQDIENFHKRGELNLSPWYQRRSVWTVSQKAYLINSIFENKPIPTCYIRHYLDIDAQASIKEVVDGQQRLRAVLGYLNDEFSAPRIGGLAKYKYSELPQVEKRNLKMQRLSVGYLIDATDADVIDIFGRLNSVSKTLNDQEKRNAKYSGAMKQFCLRLAAEHVDYWRENGVFSATDISRMSEVTFVSDLVYNLVNGISDYSPVRLEEMYKNFDDEFQAAEAIEKRFKAVMKMLYELPERLIRDTIFSRSPIFFSLFFALDGLKVSSARLANRLTEMDAAFNDPDRPVEKRSAADQKFYDACTASTQRIANRKIRLSYISSSLKV